jgi:hypothetical protein
MIATPLPRPAERKLRVSIRPDPVECPNPYLRLFYQALEPTGVTVVEPLKVNDDWLRERAARLAGRLGTKRVWRFDWRSTVAPVADVFSGWLEAAR